MFNLFLFSFSFSLKESVPEFGEFGWFACCSLIWLLGVGSFVYRDYSHVQGIDRKQTDMPSVAKKGYKGEVLRVCWSLLTSLLTTNIR